MANHELSVEEFVAQYPDDAQFQSGKAVMPLGMVLAAESLCPVDPNQKTDQSKITWLAKGLLAADSLLPEHNHLIPSKPEA